MTALIEAIHSATHVAGCNLAPFADGRNRPDRLVDSVLRFRDQQTDTEIGVFRDCSSVAWHGGSPLLAGLAGDLLDFPNQGGVVAVFAPVVFQVAGESASRSAKRPISSAGRVTAADGISYRVVVSLAARKLDVSRCIQILEAEGVLSHRPGFSLVDLTRKPPDLSPEEWVESGGGY